VKLAAEKKSLAVTVRLPPLPTLVWGDAERLAQATASLLANAVKFTPAGGRIELSVATIDGQHVLTVRDTGEGIAPEFLPRMFAPFSQADGGTTRSYSGLGLSLSIVRHIVLQHGGTISASSEGRGQGATVIVRLPPLAPPAAGGSAERPLQGLSVLIVDDEPDSREWMAALLQHLGAEARSVATADHALETLGSWRPDLLASDLAMPGKDGLALIREVRASAGEVARIPAVLLTAYAGAEEVRRAQDAGYDAHLTKPVGSRELVATLLDLTRKKGK
jgi:CheY-like chemotaxis protein